MRKTPLVCELSLITILTLGQVSSFFATLLVFYQLFPLISASEQASASFIWILLTVYELYQCFLLYTSRSKMATPLHVFTLSDLIQSLDGCSSKFYRFDRKTVKV